MVFLCDRRRRTMGPIRTPQSKGHAHKAAWQKAHYLKHHGPNADPQGHGDKFIVDIPAPILHDLLNDQTFIVNMNIKNPNRLPNKYIVQWLATFTEPTAQQRQPLCRDPPTTGEPGSEQRQRQLKQRLRMKWRQRFRKKCSATESKISKPGPTPTTTVPATKAALQMVFD